MQDPEALARGHLSEFHKCLLHLGTSAHAASLAAGHQHPALPCAARFSVPQASLARTRRSRPQAPCLPLDSATPAPGPALTTVPGALGPPQPSPYCVGARPLPPEPGNPGHGSPHQTATAASGLQDETGPQSPAMSFLETLALSFRGWEVAGERNSSPGAAEAPSIG